jgi:hypothetical protein
VWNFARRCEDAQQLVRSLNDHLSSVANLDGLIYASTHKFRRAVRLPDGDLPAIAGAWNLEIGGGTPARGIVLRTACRVDSSGTV